MQALRAFWAKSLLNKLALVGLIGIVCCCPIGLAGRGGNNQATQVLAEAEAEAEAEAPTQTEVPVATEAPVEVPTEAPVEVPTEAPTATEAQIYAAAVAEASKGISEGLIGLGEQLGAPELNDQDWIIQTALYTVLVEQAHADLVAIENVPADATELHAAITGATADCDASMKLLRQGIDARNVDQINEAQELMLSCSTKIQEATPLMQAFVAANQP